jgi:hypothetical protein
VNWKPTNVTCSQHVREINAIYSHRLEHFTMVSCVEVFQLASLREMEMKIYDEFLPARGRVEGLVTSYGPRGRLRASVYDCEFIVNGAFHNILGHKRLCLFCIPP